MKKHLLASVAVLLAAPAVAADLPTKKAPPPVPVITEYDWTGIFFGGNIGWGWSNGSFDSYNVNTGVFTDAGTDNRNIFLGGGQVGYRYMFPQRFVIGAEATLDWNTSGSVTNTNVVGNNFYEWSTGSSGLNGSVAAIGGYAFGDFLPYVVGGWASSNQTVTRTELFGRVGNATPGTAESNTVYRSGWTIGGGLSYHFWSNWEVFGQYRYTKYGNADIDYLVAQRLSHTSSNANAITAGVNLKF